jgi:hypothetical protein
MTPDSSCDRVSQQPEIGSTNTEVEMTPEIACDCGSQQREIDVADGEVKLGPVTLCDCLSQRREGHPPASESGFFCCDRPGCYEHVARRYPYSARRFCSPSCHQALRRVIERERRWRRRVRRARYRQGANRSQGP